MSNEQTKVKGSKQQSNKGWLSGMFFKEQNIGLNSIKEVSKTVDNNISKITEFFKQREYYLQYLLYGGGFIGVTFLMFYYQSIKVAKMNFVNNLVKQKKDISKRSIVRQSFITENNFSNNNLKVFKNKLDISKTNSYSKVIKYYKNFQQFTRYPMLLIGEKGTGKTQLFRTIFNEVRDVQFGEITYVDINIINRDAKYLSDILFFKYPEYKHYKKVLERYSQQIRKPTILLDNFHLLTQFPDRNRILEDIQYFRWIQSFNFLFASSYHKPELSFKVNLIETDFQGVMQKVFYEEFVRSLNLGAVTEEVLQLRPNIYILQDLYLCSQQMRVQLFKSIISRHRLLIQYYGINLKNLNSSQIAPQLKRSYLNDGLIKYDKLGGYVYGSEFISNIVKFR